jgi:hypothetical protein
MNTVILEIDAQKSVNPLLLGGDRGVVFKHYFLLYKQHIEEQIS